MTKTLAPSLLAAAPSAAQLDEHPFVAEVRAHALEVLAPNATRTDAHGVTVEGIEQLRALGALRHSVPVADGGLGLDAGVDRRVQEWIAYGDLNTWLVWTQHATSLPRLLALGAERGGLGPLGRSTVRGEALLGAGLSDVRGFPDRFVRAERTASGWRLDGAISWVSGWGLNSVLHVAAVEPETATVVIGLIPVDERTVGTPLDLQAARGSRTWRVELRGAELAEDEVLTTLPWSDWNAADLANSGDAHAGLFGLVFRVLDELVEEGGDAHAVADAWAPVVHELRERAYGLTDANRASGILGHLAEERADTKQRAIDALDAVTDALLTARAGRGLVGDDTAQLHARAALFLRVQSQTRTARSRRLGVLAARAASGR
ncbi:acyl-CoA dehydrogenase family protein [Microbacterium sp. ZW T5_45]|uniref:acyl-CoA dehydrogenase family protein n=1 Tax=Microbacterium sp. ZW T5_45 TaxID=3378080 RepID=UPI003854A1DD